MKADSQKYIANVIYICMLSKTLWLMFAFHVLVSGVVPYTEDPRICIRLPTKDLTETRRAGLSWACTCKSWKTSLHFTATTWNLCFNGIQFLEVTACIFCLLICCFLVNGTYQGWVPYEAGGWVKVKQSSFGFTQAACSMAIEGAFQVLRVQPCLIKALMVGSVELAWLWHVYCWGPGKAMVEGKGAEIVIDSFPLCGPFFWIKNELPACPWPATSVSIYHAFLGAHVLNTKNLVLHRHGSISTGSYI